MNSDAVRGTRTERPTSTVELGRRLSAVFDRIGTRQKASEIAERSVDQLAKYVKGAAEPPFLPLVRLCDAAGVRVEWLASGTGPMDAGEGPSHLPRQEELKVALQLVAEALTGKSLPPEKYAELVSLVYEGLAEGLPEAQILRFARLAAP